MIEKDLVIIRPQLKSSRYSQSSCIVVFSSSEFTRSFYSDCERSEQNIVSCW